MSDSVVIPGTFNPKENHFFPVLYLQNNINPPILTSITGVLYKQNNSY